MIKKVFKVLVADDSEVNLKLIRVLLQNNGYEVIEAINGEEAVKYTRLNHPDLILMDIRMPIIDGITASKMIKEDPVLKKIPIIALTASAMSPDREKIIKEGGFDGYLTKPISVKSFLEEIKNHLNPDSKEA